MNEKEFYAKIKNLLQKKLGNEIQVRMQEVRKNNNVVLQGLIIQKPGSNISPTIYLNGFYEMYQKGHSMKEIVEQILEVYQKGKVKNTIDMEFFRDFEQVKNRIVYRLINAERNKELLNDIPHIIFLDLAICFYYAFFDEELGEGMILIHNSHMEMWNTNHHQLLKLARENTQKLFKPIFVTLDAIMNNLFSCEEMEIEPDGIYVLTNKQKSQGAACILYPELLEHIAAKFKGNYYVIPSSIHEVILLKDNGMEDVEGLHEMIKETNNSQLLTEDILSDYPYYYDEAEKKLRQISSF